MFEVDSSRIEARRKRRDDFPSFVIAIGAICLVLVGLVIASDPSADLADRVAEVQPQAATAAGPRTAQGPNAALHERVAALPPAAR